MFSSHEFRNCVDGGWFRPTLPQVPSTRGGSIRRDSWDSWGSSDELVSRALFRRRSRFGERAAGAGGSRSFLTLAHHLAAHMVTVRPSCSSESTRTGSSALLLTDPVEARTCGECGPVGEQGGSLFLRFYFYEFVKVLWKSGEKRLLRSYLVTIGSSSVPQTRPCSPDSGPEVIPVHGRG